MYFTLIFNIFLIGKPRDRTTLISIASELQHWRRTWGCRG